MADDVTVIVTGTDIGPQGPIGTTPAITVTATTVSPGGTATATITGSAVAPLITFGIPRGNTGAMAGMASVQPPLTWNEPLQQVGLDQTGISITATQVSGTALTQVTSFAGAITGTAGATVLATSTVTTGTYPKVTVNNKGIVTSGTSLVASDIPTITASQVSGTAAVLNVANTFTGTVAAPTVTATSINATTVTATTVNATRMTVTSTATSPTDVTNKAYVDATAQGLNVHPYCRVASKVALTGSVTYTNGTTDQSQGLGIGANLVITTQQIDGITLAYLDRVLIKNQANSIHNGIYFVSTTPSATITLTRATDANNSIAGQVAAGDFVFIDTGTQNNTGWIVDAAGTATTPDKGIRIGTDNISFTQFSGAGTYTGTNGVTVVGNEIQGVAASTTAAGVASFSATNFSVTASGVVNTIQNITTTATPIFTSINGTVIPTNKNLVITEDIGYSVQGYDGDLASIAGLAGTTGALRKTAANTWALDTDIHGIFVSGTTPGTGIIDTGALWVNTSTSATIAFTIDGGSA